MSDLARLARVRGDQDSGQPTANTRALDLMPRDAGRPLPAASKRQKTEPGSAAAAHKAQGVRMSPDGKWIAFESDRGGPRSVYVSRADGRDTKRISGPRPATLPAWSPDGTRLAFVEREFRTPDVWGVWLYDMASGRSSRLASTGGTDLTRAAWFPDGQRLCYGHEDELTVLDIATRKTLSVMVPGGRHLASAPAVSPDSKRIVFAVAGGGTWLATLTDRRVKPLTTAGEVDALAWSPGGHEVALRNASDGQWIVERVIEK